MKDQLSKFYAFFLQEDFLYFISKNIKRNLKELFESVSFHIFIKYGNTYKTAINRNEIKSYSNIDKLIAAYGVTEKDIFPVNFIREFLVIIKNKNKIKKSTWITKKNINPIIFWGIKDYLLSSIGKLMFDIIVRRDYFIFYDKYGNILYKNTLCKNNFSKSNKIYDLFSKDIEKEYLINPFRKIGEKETMVRDDLNHDFPAEISIEYKIIYGIKVYFASFKDISIKYTLERSEDRIYSLYKNLINSNIFGLLFFDKFKNIFYINKKLNRLLQITDKEILGFDIKKVKNKSLHSVIDSVLAGKSVSKNFFYKSYFRKLDKYVRVYGFPMAINGKIFGGALMVEDLTKEYEKDKFSQILFHIIDKMSDGFLLTDKKGTILFTNNMFCKMTGYTKRELIGENPRILKSGDHGPEFYKKFWATLSSGKTFKGTFTNKKKNGEIYYDFSYVKGLKNKYNKIEHYFAIKRDITNETRTLLKEKNFEKFEALGKLSAGIAHDFNNILTGIYLNVKYIHESKEFDEDIYNKIEDTINSGKHIVEELLDYARKSEVKMKCINANHFLNRHKLFFEKLAGEKIKILIKTDKKLKTIYVNETKFLQVLLNLISNAKDAIGKEGKIIITVKNIDLHNRINKEKYNIKKGEYVKFLINDNGSGIPENILPHVFEPFFTTKKRKRGTGLGLATSYGIIKKFGGNILVDSKVGKGTSFTMLLPSCKNKNPHINKISEKKEDWNILPNEKIKILFIEDEAYIRDAMEKMLKHDKFNVEVAENGKTGLQKFRRGNFNVVITDLVMPEMNGDEVAKEILKTEKKVKIIITTGYLEENVILKKNKKLFYMKKPYDYEKLKELITTWKK